MFLKKEDILYFNVDELELYGVFNNYKELLKWMNDSNSDVMTFDKFTLKKSDNLRDYKFKVDFWHNNYPCFAFYIGKKLNERITTRDYFKVYGTAFRLMWLPEIIEFIDTYIILDHIDANKWLRDNTIKRFDLAVDIKLNTSKCVKKHFKELKQKWANYFGEEWTLETHYIWEYKKRSNKRYLIRIYDKLKDIKQKNKQSLFTDYLVEDDVTRIEIEFRTEVTKFIAVHNLLDRSYMFNLLIKYIEKHTNLFQKIKTQDVNKLQILNKKISLEDLHYNQIVRDRYISAFLGYSKTILKIWACPVDILIRNFLISENTINRLNEVSIYSLISKEAYANYYKDNGKDGNGGD